MTKKTKRNYKTILFQKMECLQSLKLKKGEDFCGGALHHMFEVGKLNNLTSLNLSECKNVDDAVVNAMVKW